MMTRVSVKNYAGKRVFFYHCNGRFAWGHILKVLRPLGITPDKFLISVNYTGK